MNTVEGTVGAVQPTQREFLARGQLLTIPVITGSVGKDAVAVWLRVMESDAVQDDVQVPVPDWVQVPEPDPVPELD